MTFAAACNRVAAQASGPVPKISPAGCATLKEEFIHTSERNGDKARYYRLRKNKFLRRELQIKSASSHKPGSSPAGSHEITKEASTA